MSGGHPAALAAARFVAPPCEENGEIAVLDRLFPPAAPGNDGRQTPKRGHPVFIAQHATATCVPPLPEPLKPSVPSLRVSGKEGNREASPRTGPESETRPSTARARAAPSS